jgi:hypothetical protein
VTEVSEATNAVVESIDRLTAAAADAPDRFRHSLVGSPLAPAVLDLVLVPAMRHSLLAVLDPMTTITGGFRDVVLDLTRPGGLDTERFHDHALRIHRGLAAMTPAAAALTATVVATAAANSPETEADWSPEELSSNASQALVPVQQACVEVARSILAFLTILVSGTEAAQIPDTVPPDWMP